MSDEKINCETRREILSSSSKHADSEKRAVWRHILQKRLELNSPEEFAAAVREACPGFTIAHLLMAEIDSAELEKLDRTHLCQ